MWRGVARLCEVWRGSTRSLTWRRVRGDTGQGSNVWLSLCLLVCLSIWLDGCMADWLAGWVECLSPTTTIDFNDPANDTYKYRGKVFVSLRCVH